MREWILRLAGTALVASAAVRLTPEGAAKRVTRLACALALTAAMLSLSDAVPLLPELFPPAETPPVSTEEAERETRFIIEKRLGEYIIARAETLGVRLEVSVTAAWSEDGFWYPYSVRLTGSVTEADRARLTEYIAEELMIPKERQEWKSLRSS